MTEQNGCRDFSATYRPMKRRATRQGLLHCHLQMFPASHLSFLIRLSLLTFGKLLRLRLQALLSHMVEYQYHHFPRKEIAMESPKLPGAETHGHLWVAKMQSKLIELAYDAIFICDIQSRI